MRRAGAADFEPLPPLWWGQRRFWPHVEFTPKQAGAGLNLAMDGAPGTQEPGYLLTPEPTCKLACATDQKRFRIEEMFKDFKNNGRGFGLELTGWRHAERWERLLLALALIYGWLVLWGAQGIAAGYQKFVDSVRQPTLSLLQTGLRFINRLRDRRPWVRFQWHWVVLTEANS